MFYFAAMQAKYRVKRMEANVQEDEVSIGAVCVASRCHHERCRFLVPALDSRGAPRKGAEERGGAPGVREECHHHPVVLEGAAWPGALSAGMFTESGVL
jgi:hypothetical protein